MKFLELREEVPIWLIWLKFWPDVMWKGGVKHQKLQQLQIANALPPRPQLQADQKLTLTLCSQAFLEPQRRLFSFTVGIQHSRTQNYVKFQHQPNFAIWVLESAKLVAWQHSFCMAAWQPWGRVLCGHQFWAVSLWSCNVADVALQHVNQESLGRCFVSQNMETSFIFFHHLSIFIKAADTLQIEVLILWHRHL